MAHPGAFHDSQVLALRSAFGCGNLGPSCSLFNRGGSSVASGRREDKDSDGEVGKDQAGFALHDGFGKEEESKGLLVSEMEGATRADSQVRRLLPASEGRHDAFLRGGGDILG